MWYTPARAGNQTVQLPPGWPRTLTIPRMGVSAPVEDISLQTKNDYEAPHRWGDVAWYDLGYRPGEQGHAVIFGHLDSYCCPAVFYRLHSLQKGDRLFITYPNGQRLQFEVQWQHMYSDTRLPLNEIFGPSATRGLFLITCAGDFHRDGSGYDHRLAVFARMVLPDGRLG